MLTTLGSAVNSVNETLLFGGRLSKRDSDRISDFIASRQGLPGSYCGLFAPLKNELDKSFKLFTGELINSNVAARHIIGEEALRLLKEIGSRKKEARVAIAHAEQAFSRQLIASQQQGSDPGIYCCGKCTAAYWRTLSTGWMPDARERLAKGMKSLRKLRAEGKWRRFPFYYTVLCLCELPEEIAREEIDYAQPACERSYKRLKATDAYRLQKAKILEAALGR